MGYRKSGGDVMKEMKIRFDDKVHAALKRAAEKQHRTMARQITFYVERDLALDGEKVGGTK